MADEAIIEGTHLQILAKGETCVLKSEFGELRLMTKAPCFFLRRAGEVERFAYKDAGIDWAAMIAGGGLTQEARKAWNLSAADVCASQAQGILRTASGLRPSKSIQSGGVYCRDKGLDEKDFWSFAHEKE